MALNTFDTTLGAIEVGCLFSMFFLGVLCAQIYTYIGTSKRGSYFLDGAVAIVWCLDLSQTVSVAHTTYTATITWIDRSKSADELITVQSMPLVILFSVLAEFAVRVVFIKRIQVFSGKRYIVALCYLVSALTLAGGLWIYALARTATSLSELLSRWDWLFTATFTAIVLSDSLITGTLCLYLKQAEHWVGRPSKLIEKLVLWTLETGLLTSFVALGLLICYQTMRHNYIHIAIYAVLPKLYSNALLALLNGRTTLRNISPFNPSLNVALESSTGHPTPRSANGYG